MPYGMGYNSLALVGVEISRRCGGGGLFAGLVNVANVEQFGIVV
jgi:hypothetical protein